MLGKASVVAPADGSVEANDRVQVVQGHFRLAVLLQARLHVEPVVREVDEAGDF